jgi:uncharacterized OsmC-like protein
MSELAPYLNRKRAVLALRQQDFTDAPHRALISISASSFVAGGTGVRPVRIGNHQLVTDSAPGLAGHGLGPTAPELLLGALASCLVHTYLLHAALQQLPVTGVVVDVSGRLDMGGVVGLAYQTPPQLEQITYVATVEGVTSHALLEPLHAAVAENCPVLNTLRLPTGVTRGDA